MYIKSMKAALYFKHGDTKVVSVIDNYPVPRVRKGQVLVKVLAAGINARDPKLIANNIPQMIIPTPKVIGTDVCGVVISTERCSTHRFTVGDKVMALLDLLYTTKGALAEYLAINEAELVIAPSRLTAVESASIPLVGLTVVQALQPYLRSVQQRSENKRILIQGGSGGLGSFAVQYCKRVLGMYVVATCSAQNAAYVQELGADIVLDYESDDPQQSFLRSPATAAARCDVVLDSKAYLYEKATLAGGVLQPDGWYVHIPASPSTLHAADRDPLQLAIPESRPDRYLANKWKQFYHNRLVQFFKRGNHLHYSYSFVKPCANQLAVIASYYASGDIIPSALNIYGMDTAGVHAALAQMESGHTRGKVVIKIAENF
jgi:NADPH:quinone reductase-like Zn-dependent oxidoreductase